MRVIIKKELNLCPNWDYAEARYVVYAEKKGIFTRMRIVGKFESEEKAIERAEKVATFDERIIAEYVDGVKQ